MKRNDTDGARDYAADTNHNVREIDAHWWELFSNYRLKRWQSELRRLMDQSGATLEDICAYTGLSMTDRAVFFTRLPKKRTAYIGIGMALDQPLETINRWISKYGMKRSLYVKDVCEDLVWIYLINANLQDAGDPRVSDQKTGTSKSDTPQTAPAETESQSTKDKVNYFKMFDSCADAVYRTYCDLWEDYIEHDEGTAQLLQELQEVRFDDEFEGITAFVTDHLDAFKTAYAKPRRMLAEYAQLLLQYVDEGDGAQEKRPLSDLRGYLDDSMINYLSGDPETIHARNRSGDRHTLSFKHIPKGRKNHIALALALGMTRDEVDRYLHMMGFTPLDAVNQDEGILINTLQKWEREHPLQRRLKRQTFGEDAGDAHSTESGTALTDEEAKQAVRDMLHLRQDLSEEYKKANRNCPYLKG